MNSFQPPSPAAGESDISAPVNAACDAFEKAWRQKPSIEAFLERVDPDERPVLLRELLKLERDLRAEERGEANSPSDAVLQPGAPDTGVGVGVPVSGAGSAWQAQSTGPDLSDSRGPLLPPTHFPRLPGYDLLKELGKGGMGVVYEARHHALKRVVAVKCIKWGANASPELVSRFQTETQAVAKLRHPGVVQIHDVGECDGLPYCTFEYLPGGSLDRQLKGKPLEARAAAELLLPLAEAMHHAHEHGIIHRDLKPGNVLLDQNGNPKISDFGLARDTQTSRQTATGDYLGTPSYMAPEQASGHAKTVGPAADVYGLGAILYECLTGRPPFQAATGVQTLHQVVNDEPVPPRRLQPRTPHDLDTICLKCLEKDPGRRYLSARDLADDLRRHLDGAPIRARPAGSAERTAKWARRHPARAGLVAALLLLVLSSATFALVYSEQQRDKAEAAVAARDREREQVYAADLLLTSRAITEGPLRRAHELLDAWRPERREGVDHRGREWHLLQRLASTASQTFRGHEGTLRALAWSADGRFLASAGDDRRICLWDASQDTWVRTFAGHAGRVFDLAFSPDGRLLASASADATVRLWDVETGRECRVLRGHILGVHAVAFHPDGQQLASGGVEGVVKVWEAATGVESFALQGHEAPVVRLQFDAVGKQLASGTGSHGTLLWNLETKKIVRRLPPREGVLVLTPDFRHAALPYPRGQVGFVDLGASAVEVWDTGGAAVVALAVSATGPIATSDAEGVLHIFARGGGPALATHRGHDGRGCCLQFRPDGRMLASAGVDGTVRLWDIPDPDQPTPYSGHHPMRITAAAFSPDGRLLASGDYAGSIAVWDTATGRREQVLGSHFVRRKQEKEPGEVGRGGVLDRAQTRLKHRTGFVGGPGDPNPIEEVMTVEGHSGNVRGLVFTPDSGTLVSAGGGDVIVWEVPGGKRLREWEHPADVSSLAVSPDGRLAATGCWDNFVRIFRLPNLELVHELAGHRDNVMCVAFDPTGKQLASGGRDQVVLVWDVATGRKERELARHTNTVSALCYRPDGGILATGGLDRAIHLWDATTGENGATLHAHTDGVTGLAFASDGRWLLSASDGTDDARLWLRHGDRYLEAATLPIGTTTGGPLALAVHPRTHDVLLGRSRLRTFRAEPFVERASVRAEQRAAAPAVIADPELRVFGYAFVDELGLWPDAKEHRTAPETPGNRFLVVAASLPFGRLKVNDTDYQRLMERWRKDPEETRPLRFGAMVLYPGRFVLSTVDGESWPARCAGRVAGQVTEGIEFMKPGVAFLENTTAPPRDEVRQLVYLAWEVRRDFSPERLQLRYEANALVPVPPLALERFRPGRPYHPSEPVVRADEGGHRLQTKLTRGPVK